MATEPVLVYGAGAVGQYLGGRLALAGRDVTLLARPALQAALAHSPLTVAEELPQRPAHAARTVPIPAITDLTQLAQPPALVLLAVKGYDTFNALPDLTRLVATGARVLTVQNGVGHEEDLRAALGEDVVLSGAFTINVSATAPGTVVGHTARGGLGLAPVSPGSVADLRVLFNPTGLPVVTTRSFRQLKWSKMLLNILGNAQAALLDLPPAELFADQRLFAVERRAFQEARAVMRAAGIGLMNLPAYQVQQLTAAMALPAPLAWRLLARRLGAGRGSKLPSLALDLRAGQGRSEILWYNGAIVTLGERYHVPTPVNALLTARVQAASADPAAWAHYRGRPDHWLAEVATSC